MKHLELDRFAHIDSIWQCWDARWKIVSALAVALMVLLLHRLDTAVMAFALSCLLIVSARLPIRGVLERLRAILLMILLFVVVLSLTAPGPRVSWAGVSISQSGLQTALLMGCRALSVILILMVAVSTSPVQKTFAALQRLRLPVALLQILNLSYRYLFLMQSESVAIRTAMRARGLKMRPSPRILRLLGNAIGMLLIRSVERADQVYLAMQARGYDGHFRALHRWRTTGRDVVKSVSMVTVGILLLWVDRFL